jgi:hypothetical protein
MPADTATCRYLTYFRKAFFLKFSISYGKDLVQNQDFRLQMAAMAKISLRKLNRLKLVREQFELGS